MGSFENRTTSGSYGGPVRRVVRMNILQALDDPALFGAPEDA
jgi:hypothetical protein